MKTMNEGINSPEAVNHLLRTRRSVFPEQFEKGRTVPEEILLEILENANWAPNHKQTEPWRFVVFTGEGLRRLGAFQAERYKEKSGTGFRPEKYAKLLGNPEKCSHAIAIICRRSGALLPEMEEIAAVSCAVQNIYLSLAAYGLGGYWSTGGLTYDPGAAGFLGLGEQDLLMGFFFLGYPAIPSVNGKRGPVGDKIRWVKD